jgi:hypothetical protein
MAAIVIPAAFLAADQLRRGLLRGEKTMWILLFGAPLAVLATLGDNAGGTTFGGTPICLFAALIIFFMILRRALRSSGKPTIIKWRPRLPANLLPMTGHPRG